MNPPTITSVSSVAATVSVVLSGLPGVTYRVRLVSAAGIEEDEQQRIGSGTVLLTPAARGRKFVIAWAVGAGNNRSEPTNPEETDVPPASETPNVAFYRVTGVNRMPTKSRKVLTLERIERPIEP